MEKKTEKANLGTDKHGNEVEESRCVRKDGEEKSEKRKRKEGRERGRKGRKWEEREGKGNKGMWKKVEMASFG